MDEIKLNKAVSDGKRAHIIIEDELFQRVHRQIEHDLISAWLNTAPKEVEEREYIFKQIHASRRYPQLFAKIAADGKLAQRDLNEITNHKRFKIV